MNERIKNLEKKLLSRDLNNDQRASIYNELSRVSLDQEPDKSLEYVSKALGLSPICNNQENLAVSLKNLGAIFCRKSNYHKALVYNKKALKIMENINDDRGVANSLNHMGFIYTRLGKYKEALDSNFHSINILDNIGDKQGIANNLNNIAILYKNLKNYKKALEYNFKALAQFKEIGSQIGEAYSYNNIGIVYKILKNFNKALEYYFLSLKINKRLKDLNGIANSFNNIGICYQNLDANEISIQYFHKGMLIREEMGDERGISVLKINLASVYSIIGKHELAIEEALHASKIAKKINLKPLIKDCYGLLTQIYTNKKDFRNALHFIKLFTELKGDISTEENNSIITEMLIKFETEKKEKEAETFQINNTELEEQVLIKSNELNKSNIHLLNEISEHKKAENQIKKDHDEKEILLHELHHRAKNNMQIIISILDKQIQYSKDEFAKKSFRKINNRIKIISITQQNLSHSKDLSTINLKKYIEDIIALLKESYSIQTNYISLNLELKDVFLVNESAAPLGLVFNELITNSILHAFPDHRKGEINIKLYVEKNRIINIQIDDNGIGLPRGFSPHEANSIGFQTIFSLVEYQLHGEIQYYIHNGLKWKIKFRDEYHTKRI